MPGFFFTHKARVIAAPPDAGRRQTDISSELQGFAQFSYEFFVFRLSFKNRNGGLMMTTLKQPRLAADSLLTLASGLAEKWQSWEQPATSGMIAKALHELLDGQDQSTKQLRAALQIHLAIVSNGSEAYTAADTANEEMLSTEQAAQLMGCSRPYVAMLIDADKLTGGMKSKGGHRKVPKSSVLQWIKTTKAARENSTDNESYRKAAADADMYAIPDEDYLRAAKNSQ